MLLIPVGTNVLQCANGIDGILYVRYDADFTRWLISKRLHFQVPHGWKKWKKKKEWNPRRRCVEEGWRRWQALSGSGCESEWSEIDSQPIKQRSLTRLTGRRHLALPEARRWMSQDEGSQGLARPFLSIKRRFSAKGRDVACCLCRCVTGQGGDDEVERAQKVRRARKKTREVSTRESRVKGRREY